MNNKLTSSAGSSMSSPTPPWIELPADVTANILRRLEPTEIMASAEKVCTTWRNVCYDPSLWRVLHIKNDLKCDYENLCRLAVDRSQGELIDITIEYCDSGTDDLLLYISDRSAHLKRTSLVLCNMPSDVLTTAVAIFPLLEELHLFLKWTVNPENIETINVSCPMLTSFTFNSFADKQIIFSTDTHALSIAKNMVNLRHLSLFGNRLSNEGLEAILSSCTKLESLDLRQCFNVDLQCEVGRRCLEQIKELRCPLDSTDDYDWVEHIYDSEDENGGGEPRVDDYDGESPDDDYDGGSDDYDYDYGCDDNYFI